MAQNLLLSTWSSLDSYELRLLLDERIGGPGQYDGRSDQLHIPRAGSECGVVLKFKASSIVAVEAGPAFDHSEWTRIGKEIESSILKGAAKVGREFSFSTLRVEGTWRGKRSKVQILPPPRRAPRALEEVADHPFILEFPIQASAFAPVTEYRRIRTHRSITLLLNVLLAGRISLLSPWSNINHLWARIPRANGKHQVKWVQNWYSAKLGYGVTDALSKRRGAAIEAIEPDTYYTQVGHDGKGLRVPADLDDSIWRYQNLSPAHQARFDRACFWLDMASRHWADSVSSSFASLVSAVEALTERGETHEV